MEQDDRKNLPSYVIDDAAEQCEAVEIIHDLLEGTLELREKGIRYLPKEPAEQPDAYTYRKNRAIFFNAVEKTLHGLVGMVFRKEPKFAADVPVSIAGNDTIEGIGEDIDRRGTHWTVFAKELFADAMADGHAFLFVDMPPPLPEGATRADEIAARRRPYWVKYEKTQAINWRHDGEGNLAQITFKEEVCEPDGLFGEEDATFYRVLRPGSWQLWREVMDAKTGQKTVLLESEGVTSLSEIPVVAIYGRKCEEFESKPPLLDLALLNIAHYQKYSDYSIYLHIASRPLLWFRGRDKSKQIEPIGPYTIFDVDGDSGTVGFAETTGAALSAARQDLLDLQEQMAQLGLAVMAAKTNTQTATETLLNHVQSDSDLATAARSLKDGLERALYFTAQYLGEPSGGSVELGATVEELTLTAQDIQAYSAMVAADQLNVETMWAMLAKACRLPEDFDPQTELAAIEKAKAEATQRAADIGKASLAAFDRGGLPPA